MILYNLKTLFPSHNQFRITKFDDDLNVDTSYITSVSGCECPQSHKPTCRHRKMLPLFLERQRQDSPWFLCFDNMMWVDPVNGLMEPSKTHQPIIHDSANTPIAARATPVPHQPEVVSPLTTSQPLSPPPPTACPASPAVGVAIPTPTKSLRRI